MDPHIFKSNYVILMKFDDIIEACNCKSIMSCSFEIIWDPPFKGEEEGTLFMGV